jgi:hypothetical protein
MMRRLPSRQPAGPARRQRGSSKFEFALAAALFAVLAGLAADRLHSYQADAETVAVKQLVTSLQAALTFKMSQLTAAQQRIDIAALGAQNPMGWLYEKPKNYLGEYYSPDEQKLAPGNWYFDRREKTLVYLLTRRKSFASNSLILLKYKVKSSRQPTIPASTPLPASIDSVTFAQVFDEPGVSGQ